MAPVPTNLGPCWLHTPPERVNTHAAPTLPPELPLMTMGLSLGPPTMAVFPSLESATDKPCSNVGADCTRTDQFRPLLAPHPSRARVDPRSACKIVVDSRTDDGGIPISGNRHRLTLVCGIRAVYGARTDQFRPLLAPHPSRARVHPRSAETAVVTISADQSGIPISGNRDRQALDGFAYRIGANQFRPLLAELPPCRSSTAGRTPTPQKAEREGLGTVILSWFSSLRPLRLRISQR